MSEVGFILLSALFLAVPVSIKYLLAFQMRHMVTVLKRQEREVQQLAMYLEAIEHESLVTRRAVRQVEGQRRQAQARRELIEDKLDRVRKTAAEVPVIAIREPAEGAGSAEPAMAQAT
jgi:hypothetical protein